MHRPLHIVFAGGGTAGHLFPGLAVARQIAAAHQSATITFIGTARPFERQRVEAAGFRFLALPSCPLPRGPRQAVRFLVENVQGYWRAKEFLARQQAAVVVALGGFASAPAARAARRCGIPYLVLEQNLLPGRATRWLSSDAQCVCTSFAETRSLLPSAANVAFTGNPLRRAFVHLAELKRQGALSSVGTRRLVVLGGSGGARSLNEEVPMAIYKAARALAGWEIIHQAGDRDLAATRSLYAKLGLAADVQPFINSLARVLAAATLVVSRAGGTTLAELAAAGVPAILVPYPAAKDDHQRKSADRFAAAGAAMVFDSREVTGRFDDRLAQELTRLAEDTSRQRAMCAAMSSLAQPRATCMVAGLVLQTAQRQRLPACA